MKRLSYLLPLLCLPGCLAKANATIIVSTSTDLCSGYICPPPPAPKSTYGGLIVNGDFGLGNFSGYSGTLTTVTDKTQGGVTGNSNYPYHYAYFASSGADQTLSQTFSTTPGDTYTVSFSLDNFNQYYDDPDYTGDMSYDFSASFGDQLLLSFTNPADTGTGTPFLYTYQAVADSTSTTLLFSGRNAPGAFDLTNVSVTDASAVTPEPDSLVLLGTGVLGLFGIARRRLRP